MSPARDHRRDALDRLQSADARTPQQAIDAWDAKPLLELCEPGLRASVEAAHADLLARNPYVAPEGLDWITASFIACAMLGHVGFDLDQIHRILFAHVARPRTTPHNFVFNVYTVFDQAHENPPFEGFTREELVVVFENLPPAGELGDGDLGLIETGGATAWYEVYVAEPTT